MMTVAGVSAGRRRCLVSWCRLGAGAGALGWVCPVAVVVVVAVSLVVIAVAGGVAVFGSERASGRVFRLLRLVMRCAEPPGPGEVPGHS